MEIHISTATAFALVSKAFNAIKSIYPKTCNYYQRPNLFISIRQHPVEFTLESGEISLNHYLCIIIENRTDKDIFINPNAMRVNNESYIISAQADINFLRLNPQSKPHITLCDNGVYNYLHDNWVKVCSGTGRLTIKPAEPEVFPILPLESFSHSICAHKKEPKLFFPKSKVIITLEMNGKSYEYGLNRIGFYEKCINFLAFPSIYNSEPLKRDNH